MTTELKDIVAPAVYELNDHIICFYLGRNVTPPSPVSHIEGNWVDLDWLWGVCSYVIYRGTKAVVYDTNVYPDQALWIRRYMEQEKGVTEFTVVTSHWHLDHIAGNCHFKDAHIIATQRCRQEMAAVKEKVEQGAFWGPPAIEVVLPDITFDDKAVVYLDDIEIQLHRFHIHTPDSIIAYLPQEKLVLCGDMLEDTLPFVLSIEEVELQKNELNRLKEIDADVFYPDHGNPEKIENGGYGPSYIDAVLEYYDNLIALHEEANYEDLPVEAFIPQALANKTLSVWEPYIKVHKGNVKLVKEYFAQ